MNFLNQMISINTNRHYTLMTSRTRHLRGQPMMKHDGNMFISTFYQSGKKSMYKPYNYYYPCTTMNNFHLTSTRLGCPYLNDVINKRSLLIIITPKQTSHQKNNNNRMTKAINNKYISFVIISFTAHHTICSYINHTFNIGIYTIYQIKQTVNTFYKKKNTHYN